MLFLGKFIIFIISLIYIVILISNAYICFKDKTEPKAYGITWTIYAGSIAGLLTFL